MNFGLLNSLARKRSVRHFESRSANLTISFASVLSSSSVISICDNVACSKLQSWNWNYPISGNKLHIRIYHDTLSAKVFTLPLGIDIAEEVSASNFLTISFNTLFSLCRNRNDFANSLLETILLKMVAIDPVPLSWKIDMLRMLF